MKLIISRNVAVLLCMPMVSMAALGGPRDNEEKGGRTLFDAPERMTRRRDRFPKGRPPKQGRRCKSTRDCGESEYCLEGRCTETGKCRSDADCFNPENTYPIIECLGPISCDADTNRCGRECSESNCPADKPPVQCLAAPCDVIASTCKESFVSCVDYYCGGCDAFLFDKAGNQVCEEESTGNPTSPSDGVGQTCNSSNDCADEEYCAGGICLPDGDCNTDIDCKNPENIFASILCFGVTGCYEGGKCGVECGPSSCPEGQEEAACLVAPCDNPPECEEDWEYCVDSYCGGCKAILLDAAGNEVTCTPL